MSPAHSACRRRAPSADQCQDPGHDDQEQDGVLDRVGPGGLADGGERAGEASRGHPDAPVGTATSRKSAGRASARAAGVTGVGQLAAAWIFAPAVLKVVLARVPRVPMAVRHTTTTRANMTAYSNAVGPSSCFTKRTSRLAIALIRVGSSRR